MLHFDRLTLCAAQSIGRARARARTRILRALYVWSAWPNVKKIFR